VLAAMAAVVAATYGLDLSAGGCDSSCFSCLKNNDYSFAVVRGFQSVGHVDPNVAASVAAAWAGGMAHVDVYMFPDPTAGNPAGQVQECVNNLRSQGVTFGMLWFDIEGPQYWMGQEDNQVFMNGLIAEGRAMGVNLGIYSSASQWDPIFGGSYSSGSGLPLWYAHYDGEPNFNDFVPFGGWSSPAIKQYHGTTAVCGFDIDQDWYPDGARGLVDREAWPLRWPAAFNHTMPYKF